MRIHSQQSGFHRGRKGFSLIEVMVAIIILATGLLALAALQINLTKSTADAKARSRIAALLTTIIDYQRAQGLSNVTAISGSAGQCVTSTPTTIQTSVCTAQSDAGVTGIGVTSTVTEYYAIPSATSFGTTAPGSGVNIYGDYKRVDMTATWTDSTGTSRSLGATTLTSNLELNSGSSTLLSLNLLTSANLSPVVHETNPSSTAGVIPIAIGTNTNTAATNPKPTVQTSGASSTTFNTLTYTQGVNDSSSTSTIQKRVETEVAECVCQGSTSNPFSSSTLYGQYVYRPTYWNGTQYASPTIATSGGSNVTPYATSASSVSQQSSECQICCRDHLDLSSPSTASTSYSAPLYDEVTGDLNRYKVTATTSHGSTSVTSPISLSGTVGHRVAVTNFTDSSQPWLDACRMIRVDGLWRVASDLTNRQMGLLATSPEGFATSSTPDTSSESAYQDFVVDFLGQYVTYIVAGGSAPSANTIFASHGLDVPAIIDAVTTTGNYRYLHARGLYVDYLESSAVTKLSNIKASSSCTNNYPTCILPYLPFATINLTGVGYSSWKSADTSKATVGSGTDSGTTGVCSSTNFFGGCVSGKAVTSSVIVTADYATSNSAVAASLYKNPTEETSSSRLTDTQNFDVTGTNTADQYYVQMSGPTVTLTDPSSGSTSLTVTWLTSDASTTNEPNAQWGFGVSNATAGPDACFTSLGSSSDTNPNPYNCVTTVLLSGVPTTQLNTSIGNYNQIISNPIANPCSGGTGSYNQPTLVCYTVSSVTLTTDSAATSRIDCYGNGSHNNNCYNITSPYTVSNSKTTNETTTIVIASKNQNPAAMNKPYLNVTFSANGTSAGSYTCDNANIPTFTNPTSCP
jgi:prepilin-type N-terminal cleavage/methylation domain-containing protein